MRHLAVLPPRIQRGVEGWGFYGNHELESISESAWENLNSCPLFHQTVVFQSDDAQNGGLRLRPAASTDGSGATSVWIDISVCVTLRRLIFFFCRLGLETGSETVEDNVGLFGCVFVSCEP